MFTVARRIALALAATLAPALGAACGSSVETPSPGTSSGQGGEFTFITGEGGSTATMPMPPEPPRPPVPPDYDDPGCADAPPPIEAYTCDPFDPYGGGCLLGEACKLTIDYPSEPCGQEVYGSVCALAGTGGQGDACGDGADCGPGHVCVITGSGTQCVRLCKVDGPSGCPSGLVCEPLDVKGFGGCL
jgi:hypothetical protein